MLSKKKEGMPLTDNTFMRVEEVAQVTEKLKADNRMEWVSRMNNIRSRATETVNTDLIYT